MFRLHACEHLSCRSLKVTSNERAQKGAAQVCKAYSDSMTEAWFIGVNVWVDGQGVRE